LEVLQQVYEVMEDPGLRCWDMFGQQQVLMQQQNGWVGRSSMLVTGV
jgi:hypothetical protein